MEAVVVRVLDQVLENGVVFDLLVVRAVSEGVLAGPKFCRGRKRRRSHDQQRGGKIMKKRLLIYLITISPNITDKLLEHGLSFRPYAKHVDMIKICHDDERFCWHIQLLKYV